MLTGFIPTLSLAARFFCHIDHDGIAIQIKREYGFAGGYTVVKDYVRLARTRSREVFIPLAHPPGHAQVDFGECIGVIGGVRMKLHVFCFDLPQSDACFIKAYPAETTEAFLDGHVSAFAFFGGVPISILYDNLKIAVARILGDGKRQRTRAFTELVSHYLFEDRFGRDEGSRNIVPIARSLFDRMGWRQALAGLVKDHAGQQAGVACARSRCPLNRFAASTAWTSSHSGLFDNRRLFAGIGITFVGYLAAVKPVLKNQIKCPAGELLTPIFGAVGPRSALALDPGAGKLVPQRMH